MLQDVFDDAQALDDDDLYDCYTKDEKETLRYDCLVYSKMERKWLARFIPVPGKAAYPAPFEADYSLTETAAAIMVACGMKPSQSLKALADFHRRMDIDAGEIVFPEPSR